MESRLKLWYGLALSCFLTFSSALEAIKENAENNMKEIVNNYMDEIPDIDSKMVINEKLADAITNILGGKISTLPLLKLSLKIHREPVKIPWVLEGVDKDSKEIKTNIKKYTRERAT